MKSRLLITIAFCCLGLSSFAQQKHDVFGTSNCLGCHGQSAMGGLGPPIAQTKLTFPEFSKIVREGKGMMPATPPDQLSEADAESIYAQVQAMPWRDGQIPLAYKVGQFLATKNIALLFLVVTGFSLLFALRVVAYWLRCAGARELLPHLRRLGWIRASWIALSSLVVDGFLVASLWRKSKHRWFMHGLMLYGFFGLMLADVLMQIFNPSRGDLPLVSPLKLLPIVSGAAVFTGVLYVMWRYRRDPYVDNGLTQGRDFLFVSLLFHTVLSGFLTVWINKTSAFGWIMPLYVYHLSSVLLLIATAPFTRFAHAFVVPVLVAMTRLTEAVTASGVDLGFEREPMPGRHHKSERIVAGVLKTLGPEYQGGFNLRYYP